MGLAKFNSAHLNAISKLLTTPVDDGPKTWLDLGYAPLNMILSGDPAKGFPGGRMIEIAGPAASGKTLLATMAMIAAQQAGGVAIFEDWERAFSAKFAQQIGLNTEPGYFTYNAPDTWEAGNSHAMRVAQMIRGEQMIDPKAPIVAVFDSIAAAVPRSMLYDSKGNRRDIDEYTMNDTSALARVSSTTLKVINQMVSELNITAIYLNQLRLKLGVVYGDPHTTPGGKAMEFYASQRLFTGSKNLTDSDKEFQGRLIGLKTQKNKLTKPMLSAELRLMYQADGRPYFDYTVGYLEELVKLKVLEKKGKQIVWEGKAYYAAVLAAKLASEDRVGELREMYCTHADINTMQTEEA